MKKLLITISIFSFAVVGTNSCFSQDFTPPATTSTPARKPFWDWSKVYLGGGLGGGFTSYEAAFNISPLMGYRFTERFSAGIGLVYNYYENRLYVPTYKLNIYGGSIFVQQLIASFLFAHAEYELLNGPWAYPSNRRFNIHNFWVGGGLRQAVGPNAAMMVSVLWNLNQTPYSYPFSPQIRIAVVGGF